MNYGIGGHYKPHTDYFDDVDQINTDVGDVIRNSGDRLVTFLLYLTNVQAGGGTVFTKLNLHVSCNHYTWLNWSTHMLHTRHIYNTYTLTDAIKHTSNNHVRIKHYKLTLCRWRVCDVFVTLVFSITHMSCLCCLLLSHPYIYPFTVWPSIYLSSNKTNYQLNITKYNHIAIFASDIMKKVLNVKINIIIIIIM